jgi:hypothetical protein
MMIKSRSSVGAALGIGSVKFSGRLSFTCSIGLVSEGSALVQSGTTLAATTSNYSTMSSETLVGAGVAIFEGFRTTSRTLAIFLPFLGVAVGAVAVLDNLGITGGLCRFGYYSALELFGSVFSN